MGLYSNPIVLTKPPEKSERVRAAQWLLAGHNRLATKPKTYGGPIDGIAGPRTMEAARAMKWKLGYPADACDRVFGQTIYNYLVGKQRRPAAYLARVAKRYPKRPVVLHSYPLSRRARIIGYPNQGTHTRGNWQSDRAFDLSTPVGTPLLACFAGTIGSRWGDFGGGGVLAGSRIYVERSDGQQIYYAHASKLLLRPGTKVAAGQKIGLSGSAVGVPHLHVACRYGDPYEVLLGGSVPALSSIRSLLSSSFAAEPEFDEFDHGVVVPLMDVDLEERGPTLVDGESG